MSRDLEKFFNIFFTLSVIYAISVSTLILVCYLLYRWYRNKHYKDIDEDE